MLVVKRSMAWRIWESIWSLSWGSGAWVWGAPFEHMAGEDGTGVGVGRVAAEGGEEMERDKRREVRWESDTENDRMGRGRHARWVGRGAGRERGREGTETRRSYTPGRRTVQPAESLDQLARPIRIQIFGPKLKLRQTHAPAFDLTPLSSQQARTSGWPTRIRSRCHQLSLSIRHSGSSSQVPSTRTVPPPAPSRSSCTCLRT